MTPWSLRARMLTLSATATLLALAIAGWTTAGVLARFVTQSLDQRLDAQIALMATAVREDGSVDRLRIERQAGAMAADAGWRWRIVGPDGTTSSADFPVLDPAPRPPERHSPLGVEPLAPDRPVPREGRDREGPVHARQATMITSRGPVTLIAGVPSQVVAQPIRAALVPLLTVVAVLAVLFALAAFFQLRFALRPVMVLRKQVGEIRGGMRRHVEEDQPAELQPLAVELNALASESAAALDAARASAANLAHALKTPVATLALMVGDVPQASAQIHRIEEVIRHHLARARTAAVGHRAWTPLGTVVADISTVIGSLYPKRSIAVDVPAQLAVSLDAHDLSEIVGNVLDNAARHARSVVCVSASAEGRHVILCIEDDGPGIPAQLREQAMRPGVRLDETPTGDGFGLAIVRDLVALHGGSLELTESMSGGLLVRITLLSATELSTGIKGHHPAPKRTPCRRV